MNTTRTRDAHVYTVSELNAAVKNLLQNEFGMIRIAGEISGHKTYPSGHHYFSLKDEGAEVRCAMFRSRAGALRFAPEDGAQVEASASVTLYEDRGQFQLIIATMTPVGEGLLLQKIEQLKKRLDKEGLFDPMHKKTPPEAPRTVGVLTSTSGSVLHDILRTLKRRYPLAGVVVYPVAVQGENAASSICEMLETANRRAEADVLILARGGGSVQDLMAFNDEALARAVFNSRLPVVTGIGHEPDYSIADFVADRREATPTAAAQSVVPDIRALRRSCDDFAASLGQAMDDNIARRMRALSGLCNTLAALNPRTRLQNAMQHLDHYTEQAVSLITRRLDAERARVSKKLDALHYLSPLARIKREREGLAARRARLHDAVHEQLRAHRTRLTRLQEQIRLLDPDIPLRRGYAVVSDADGRPVRSVGKVNVRDAVTVAVRDGALHAEVKKITRRKPGSSSNS